MPENRAQDNPLANALEINSGACVHTHIRQASCQRCVEVCPHDAIEVSNTGPTIDQNSCDVCSLCAAACSEGVLQSGTEVLSLPWQDKRIALFICDRVLKTSPKAREAGYVTCKHALSLRSLFTLAASNHSRILGCTDDCQKCGRQSFARFENRLEQVNSFLRSRNKPTVTYHSINPAQFKAITQAHENESGRVARSKRKWFGLGKIDAYGKSTPGDSTKATLAPGQFFSRADSENPTLPFVPQIDLSSCTACGICVQLCPHEALDMARLEDRTAYQISAENCTNCGICIDVCEAGAIEIRANTSVSQTLIELETHECSACGHPFRTLKDQSQETCPICESRASKLPLFQRIS